MEDDKEAKASPIPLLGGDARPASRSVQRRIRAQQEASPDPPLAAAPSIGAPLPIKAAAAAPPPRSGRYRVVETVELPAGASTITLTEGEEISSRQYDVPLLVRLGARLQELVE